MRVEVEDSADNVAIMRIIHIRTPTQSHPAYLWTSHPIDTEDTEDQVRNGKRVPTDGNATSCPKK